MTWATRSLRPRRGSRSMRTLITPAWIAIAFVLLGGLATQSAYASVGMKSFDVTFSSTDGSPDTQAGSHPYAMKTSFEVNTEETGKGIFDEELLKDLEILQVPGFVGDQTAVPQCSARDFSTVVEVTGVGPLPSCPDGAAVGIAKITIGEEGARSTFSASLYNLEPPPGKVAKLGFVALGVPVLIEVGLNSAPPYNLLVSSRNISQILEFFGAEVTIWGVPASPSHDKERGHCYRGTASCPAGVKEAPFLTLPPACDGPLSTEYELDSWEHPGSYAAPGVPDLTDQNWVTGSAVTHDETIPPSPQGMSGCGKLTFAPSISAKPTTVAASSPTGLDFGLDVNDEGLKNPSGLAQSDIKKVVVALPEAVSVNPALAEGLSACSEADLARESASSIPGGGCPNESKIGSVEVETPLLAKTLKGSLFLASPYVNPFGSLLALYVVIKDPETGIFLKIPGKIEPDLATGRLVSVFDNLPQLPFSHFRLDFRQGQRSPLVTPAVCGTYTTQAELTPWARPTEVLHDSSTFQVTTGIDGAACPAGGLQPFKPSLIAGTANNNAGGYSPVDIRITRNDGEQEITGFASLLPSGLTANLTGVPFCDDAQIGSAKAKTGAQELAEPSCPRASEIGHTLVGVGVGSVLAYTPGKLYMGGPFEGAPFSVVAITSAKVGPFDLGTVIVHLPLNIDPVTAQVSIPAGAADQIPHIIKGIVVHVRDIRVYVDKPNFTLNPTNCNPLTFGASVIGSGQNFVSPADDVAAAANNRFQTANCANLGFKPSFKVSTNGKTSRKSGASLSVKLAYPKAPQGTQANIRSVKVDLPKQLPSRLTTLQQACTDAQFTANPAGCPAASRVGQATAVTPILPVPIAGPVYFVSHGGAKFPELILVLQGYGVTIDLHGETFISKVGITSSTFHAVPDQPVTSFELTLPQGKNSALAANGNLCAAKLAMPTLFTGQNGATIKQSTRIAVTGCPKHKTKHKAKKARRSARGARATHVEG